MYTQNVSIVYSATVDGRHCMCTLIGFLLEAYGLSHLTTWHIAWFDIVRVK
jgi:hypothetical protein